MAVYNADENLTPVLLTAMHTCFMSHLLVLVSRQLVLTATLCYTMQVEIIAAYLDARHSSTVASRCVTERCVSDELQSKLTSMQHSQ